MRVGADNFYDLQTSCCMCRRPFSYCCQFSVVVIPSVNYDLSQQFKYSGALVKTEKGL